MDTLVGSVCGYLLLSAVFAAAYSTLVLLQPDSFIVDERLTLDPSKLHFQGAHFDVLLYFSVITLTTVGFGDIIPATTFARELVSAEAIMGQVYITMIVARLVGMHLTASLR
jgi:voltage-gated potassium channel